MIELWSLYRTDKRYASAKGRDLILQDVYDPNILRDTVIRLDGKDVRVTAIETFSIMRSSESPYTLPFGIYYEDV